MSFLERLCNFLSATLLLIAYYNYHLPMQEEIMQKYYDQERPPIEEMVTNISLYLLNVHPTAQYPQPYPPNIIPVGGAAISTERTQIPQDIQKFMDTAEVGVIYFSLGTVVPVHIFPKEIINIFLIVFAKLRYRVLWKIDPENLSVSLPKNVMTTKWVPQLGVLTHPKCVLFVTHAGLLGQQEAIYAGVPTVAIPFFGDQFYNAKLVEERQIGVKLYFKDLTEETFYSATTKVLTNSTDQPLSPVDTATYWVEYVLRHRGAPHLRPAAAHMRWYHLALLDVAAAAMSALIFAVGLLYFIVAKIISSFKKVKSINKDKKKN